MLFHWKRVWPAPRTTYLGPCDHIHIFNNSPEWRWHCIENSVLQKFLGFMKHQTTSHHQDGAVHLLFGFIRCWNDSETPFMLFLHIYHHPRPSHHHPLLGNGRSPSKRSPQPIFVNAPRQPEEPCKAQNVSKLLSPHMPRTPTLLLAGLGPQSLRGPTKSSVVCTHPFHSLTLLPSHTGLYTAFFIYRECLYALIWLVLAFGTWFFV